MRCHDWNEMTEAIKERGIGRRAFLQLSGAGLFIFFAPDLLPAFQEASSQPGFATDFNAYLRIGEDGRVACFAGKTELGQGATTTLAQLVSDELDVSFDAVDVVLGDTEICPWDEGTFGSLTVREFAPVLRGVAAEARAVLLQMAAEYLHLPSPDDLRVKDGVITSSKDAHKNVSYAQLVQGKRIERHLGKVPLKPISDLRVIGTSPRRKDALDKVTGKGRYAADILLPGMLHARVLRPPAHGATLNSADTSAAEKIPGIQVIRDKDMIALLHERRDVAEQALGLVQAKFDLPHSGPDDATIFDHLIKAAPPFELVSEKGRLADGEQLATHVVEETYLNSYVAHAPMETHSAVAKIDGTKLTVWASTQTPFSLRHEVAEAMGFAPENVRVITPYVGGGFGGKTENSSHQAQEAARLTKLTGRPIQVVFNRTEEFFYDTFRPAAVVKIRSGTDKSGKLVLWEYRAYGGGGDEASPFYDIPHQRTQSAGGWSNNPAGLHPLAVGPWRAPAASTNTFARESHIDEIASRLGRDPLEFRLIHLSDPRMHRVLQTATEKFAWKPAPAPSGRGFGLACATYADSYVATVAEVVVDKKTGNVDVKRVLSAQDQGFTVNPEGSRQQIEGSITMGMGYALAEEVRFKNGAVLDRNFDTYQIPRFSWLPKIETVLIDNPSTPSSGCGEPPIVTIGAALANAVFDATGRRPLQLPMTAARLKAALQQV
ncbi:MAG TPA: molybdopterin cofactor-binding domain-containing protein [Candidatus Eisenbacteria bacterium]|nr:molybdopterin cofactor-binding domain-containing protein [Candidatus Eisenbacteria bacterium]